MDGDRLGVDFDAATGQLTFTPQEAEVGPEWWKCDLVQ